MGGGARVLTAGEKKRSASIVDRYESADANALMALGAVLAAASQYVLRTEHQPPNEVALTVPIINARFTWQHAGGAWPRGRCGAASTCR